jgi:hypothetical protein
VTRLKADRGDNPPEGVATQKKKKKNAVQTKPRAHVTSMASERCSPNQVGTGSKANSTREGKITQAQTTCTTGPSSEADGTYRIAYTGILGQAALKLFDQIMVLFPVPLGPTPTLLFLHRDRIFC